MESVIAMGSGVGGGGGDIRSIAISVVVGIVAGLAGGFGHGLLVDVKERRITRVRRLAFVASCRFLATSLVEVVELSALSFIRGELVANLRESFIVVVESGDAEVARYAAWLARASQDLLQVELSARDGRPETMTQIVGDVDRIKTEARAVLDVPLNPLDPTPP